MSPAQVVAFDLDGTLVRGDCVARLLRASIRSNWLRLSLALPLLPLLPLMRWSFLAAPLARALMWIATVGKPQDAWQAQLDLHVQSMRTERRRWVIAAALQQLHQHIERGDRVLVVTGAFQSLAEAIVSEVLDVHGVEVIGSTVRWQGGALRCVHHCFGRRKLDRLCAHGIDLPLAGAYSDSEHDFPLLRSARTQFWVGRSEHLWRRARSRLPALQWIQAID